MKKICIVFFMLNCSLLHAGGTFTITDFGATPNSGTLQTAFIQAAIDSAEHAGGGTVIIPQGTYLSSTLFLKDNVILQIDRNAVLRGGAYTGQYPDVIPAIRTYADRYPQRSLIYAEGKRNIGITGEGTLDGNGLSSDFLFNADHKPLGVRFIHCTNVSYEGITMRNAGFWMMHNLNCDSLTIKNLKIVNHNLGNGDGINIDGSKHVVVENCNVDSNDDPMVIKTTNADSVVDVEIRNCTFATYSRAIKIGTETYGPIKNVHIHDCEVKYSTLGPLGSLIAGDCGIQLSMVDGGMLDNVVVENIQIKGVQTPIFIRLGARTEPFQTGGPIPGTGSMQHVVLRNITAEAAGDIASSMTGIPGFPVRQVRLENIDLTVPGGKDSMDGYVVPENVSGKPGFDMFGNYLPAYGFYIRHVDSLAMENICIHTKQPDERSETVWDDTTKIHYSGCRITAVSQRQNDPIKIYPNPVKGLLNIESSMQGMCRVIDIFGRKRIEQKITGTQQMDISMLPQGVYYLSFSGKSECAIPLIKE
jgi:hypothetical protein